MTRKNPPRAFWIREPGIGELRTAPIAPPEAGEVEVRTLFSGISRGTETLVFRGGVPPSQYGTMRCPFQEGAFPGPVKYGYAAVGVVEAGALPRGQVVFALHPHQERFVVPATAVVPVPEPVPAGRAVLTANLETALTILWDSGISAGDRVLVVGGGVVGLLAGWLAARIPATEVLLVDRRPEREGVARALGMDFALSVPEGPFREFDDPSSGLADLLSDAGNPSSGLADLPSDSGVPVVVSRVHPFDRALHASGSPEGAGSALRVLGTEGVLIEASWFGDRPVPLPLGEAFHARRLTIRSSQVGRMPPDRAPRWNHPRRMGVVMRLLADPVLDRLISGESSFEALPETLHQLALGERDALCHRIRYPE